MSATPKFISQGALGAVQGFEIQEASGIVASRQNAGILWTHNDSSYRGVVFALSTNGALLGRYAIPSVFYGDFEDIAIGPGPSPESQYIYLGDIGDNFAARSSIRVFRFAEPAVYTYQASNPRYESVTGAQEIELTYPDGPFNAEALMVDPRDGDLFIATKLLGGSRIYRASRAELDGGGPVTLTFVRQVGFFKVSGGDISPDGRLVALRRGNSAAMWIRPPGQSIGDALGGIPISVPVIGEPAELNGEAIGFHPTGLGYYTISEGPNQPIYFFRRADAGLPRQPKVFIGAGETWSYQDRGTDEGTAWREPEFADAAWASGPAQLGYGQGDERTIISPVGGPGAGSRTTYLRKTFRIDTPVPLGSVVLRLCFNDGVAVYLNGAEVLRKNLASEARFDQPADASNSDRQNQWYSALVDSALLHAGTNTIAVELHRQASIGPGLSFDLQLIRGALEVDPGPDPGAGMSPTVSFTSPAPNAVVTNAVLSVRGTAGGRNPLAQVAWAVGSSAFQPARGTKDWSADVPLGVGTNLVFAVAYDARTNASEVAVRKFVRLATSLLTLQVSGPGTVTPNLNGASLIVGQSYALSAAPAPRNLFAGWTGGIVTNATRLNFLMSSNLILQANFVTNPFIALKGQYRGLFGETNLASPSSSGAVTVNVTDRGTFTAVLRFGGKSVSLSGQFDLEGKASRQFELRSSQSTNQMTISLCLDVNDGTDLIAGQVSIADWTAQLLAYRSPSYSQIDPTPYAGRYTLFISGGTGRSGPVGHGVAAILVSANGATTLAGTLADGTKVTQSGAVSRMGWWPFYVPLYGGKGSVLSWLTFTNDTADSLFGECNWIKPGVPGDRLYPAGFTNTAPVYGSPYSSQAMTQFLAAHTRACLSVNGLAPEIQTNCLTLAANNTFVGAGFKTLKLDLPTGLWTGTYTNPVTGNLLPAKFTILLEDDDGYGYVLSTNASAAIEWLAPP